MAFYYVLWWSQKTSLVSFSVFSIFWVWVYVCMCQYTCMCKSTYTCICMHVEARNQVLLLRSHPPCILRQSLTRTWSLPSRLGWLGSEAPGSACLPLSSTGFASMYLQASFLSWMPGMKVRSSHLHDEPSPHPHYFRLCSMLTFLGPLWRTDICSETTVIQWVGAVMQTSDWRVFQDKEMAHYLMCVWEACVRSTMEQVWPEHVREEVGAGWSSLKCRRAQRVRP